ncbi:MAG TPA: hypothetical protein VGU66_10375 [Candidatus Elarobacter sp.]|nr:hypothetical protein [Candidatus Elarobacter sp.]
MRALGIAGLLLALVQTASAQPDPGASKISALGVYTRMVDAMRAQKPPPRLSYRETFEPQGLVVSIRKRRKDAPAPALVFSPATEPVVLQVQETPESSDVLDTTTGLRYAGAKVFWAASWADARVANGNSGASTPTSAAVSPAPETEQSGSVAGFNRARADVIGQVSISSDRYYAIEDAGSADVDGKSAIHLRLIARSDPVNHPLTDLYVDPATYMLRRADAAFKNEAYVSGYAGTISLQFGAIGNYWMIVKGRIEGNGHFLLKRAAGAADFHISHVTFPAT